MKLTAKKYSLFLKVQEKYPEHTELIGKFLEVAFVSSGIFPKSFYISGEYHFDILAKIAKEFGISIAWSSHAENFRNFKKATYITLSDDSKNL